MKIKSKVNKIEFIISDNFNTNSVDLIIYTQN